MSKKVIAVVFGGVSSEHDVSKVSAETVIKNLNPEKYTILPVYITETGEWKLYEGPIESISSGNWARYAPTCIISPDRAHKGLIRIVGDKHKVIPVDLVYLVLHGANGEDGTIQGLLELAGLPYIGCGVLSSAVSMNKAYTKLVVEKLGIAQAEYVTAHKYEIENDVNAVMDKVEAKCSYPVFVKPACAGSSVGITKAH
ncbi:MAG: D-alanine--D-alanine ligase A, partial [Firmicutes bacterium]|nr:D-alanine--D-alanine ligase A [Bacillota bacterium]